MPRLGCAGLRSKKIDNIFYLDEGKTIAYAAGNVVLFLDLGNKCKQSYLPSTSGCGVGAIAVHPNKQYLCVCEIGVSPHALVYEYPSLKLYRVLRNGTERAYSAAAFSASGQKLATVGAFPDYMLTVWDWQQESTILRSKAFSQDVRRHTFERIARARSAAKPEVKPAAACGEQVSHNSRLPVTACL